MARARLILGVAAAAAAASLLLARPADAQPAAGAGPPHKSRTSTRTRTRSHTATATATATATSTASASSASHPAQPELWAAFFVINGTGPGCNQDTTDVSFYAARWAPMTGATGNASVYALAQPYAWPTLTPIHSKTLSQGSPMAVDAVGRRGWALFGTTDWTAHVWVMQLSFPRDDPSAIVVEGVCELVGASYYQTKLFYHHALSADGPWFLNYSYPTTATVGITVPPLDAASGAAGGGGGVPACRVSSISVIDDAALQWNTLPPPFVGTDAAGAPLFVSVSTSQTNSSQTNLTVWSPSGGGARVYGPTTWACGYPSYLYACPPTTGANWPQSGLLATYLVNGTLLLGGGSWSAQQFFMTQLPPLAGGRGAGAGAGAATGDGTPVLTFVNVSSDAATWMPTFNSGATGFLPGGAGSWPLSVVNMPTSAGSCVAPSWIGLMEVDILDATGWRVNASTLVNAISPGCPLRASEVPWLASANCAGASIGLPDLPSAFH